MVQPALKADTLLARVADLWKERLAIHGSYLPLERLQREAEELDKAGIPGREIVWMVLASVHAIKRNRDKTYSFINKILAVPALSSSQIINVSLFYNYFCDFFKSLEFYETIDSSRDVFPREVYNHLYLFTGRWKEIVVDNLDQSPFETNAYLRLGVVEIFEVQDIIEKFNISQDHIVYLQMIASEVLIEANAPLLKFSVEAIFDDVLVTYYVDNRWCESGMDLTMRFLDKLHQHPDHAKNYGRIVISFVASSLEELQGDGETG